MIYVFLANGFEETEAITTIDILKRAEYQVVTVSITNDLRVTSTHHIPVIADVTIDDAIAELENIDLQMVVLPGGMPGTLNLDKSEKVTEIVKYCNNKNKYIGAICAAPSVLGHIGLLKDKKATCFPGFEGELNCKQFTNNSVTVDSNIITAKGAGVTINFALELLKMLDGNDIQAKKIFNAIQCEK